MSFKRVVCMAVVVPLLAVLLALGLTPRLPQLDSQQAKLLLVGKVVVVTGSTAGIGYASAKKFYDLGATVVVHGRDPTRTAKAASTIGPTPRVVPMSARLTDTTEVRRFAAELSERFERIDYLVNNAGMMWAFDGKPVWDRSGFSNTSQYDLSYASNHMGHFLLTKLLLPKLRASRATVVVVSSIAHYAANPDWLLPSARPALEHMHGIVDVEFAKFAMYGTGKLANLLFATELSRRENDITVAAMTPGFVATHIGVETRDGTANSDMEVFLAYSTSEAGEVMVRVALNAHMLPSGTFATPYYLPGVLAWVTDYLPQPLQNSLMLPAVLCEMSQKITGSLPGSHVFVSRPNSIARDHSLALRLWEWTDRATATATKE